MAKKYTRPIQELVRSLQNHARLLEEHATKAFEDNDGAYLGEVAGKLRLLVCKSASNTPLLLAIMAKLGIDDIQIALGGPPIRRHGTEPIPGDRVSLHVYLKMLAYGIRTPSHGFVRVSKHDLITMWAQELGASHEGWELDERLLTARDCGMFLGGRPALVLELKVTTETILHVANQLLAHPKFIAALES